MTTSSDPAWTYRVADLYDEDGGLRGYLAWRTEIVAQFKPKKFLRGRVHVGDLNSVHLRVSLLPCGHEEGTVDELFVPEADELGDLENGSFVYRGIRYRLVELRGAEEGSRYLKVFGEWDRL